MLVSYAFKIVCFRMKWYFNLFALTRRLKRFGLTALVFANLCISTTRESDLQMHAKRKSFLMTLSIGKRVLFRPTLNGAIHFKGSHVPKIPHVCCAVLPFSHDFYWWKKNKVTNCMRYSKKKYNACKWVSVRIGQTVRIFPNRTKSSGPSVILMKVKIVKRSICLNESTADQRTTSPDTQSWRNLLWTEMEKRVQSF